MHGLVGRVSNRACVLKMDKFKEFIRENRVPTGRTADANGRFHGAVFLTLDPKIRSSKSKQTLSLKGSLEGDFKPLLSSSHAKH